MTFSHVKLWSSRLRHSTVRYLINEALPPDDHNYREPNNIKQIQTQIRHVHCSRVRFYFCTEECLLIYDVNKADAMQITNRQKFVVLSSLVEGLK